MNPSIRQQVLKSFKLLHRTRQKVFEGDGAALEKGRVCINEEYRSKKNVNDKDAVVELLKLSQAVEKELRTTVVQAKQVEPGKYELRITEDTVKLNNVPYKHKECSSN